MAHRHSLALFFPALWELYRDLRLSSLLDSPDAFGGTHALEAARPPEVWQSRLAAAATSGLDLPLLARVGELPAGLCWAKRDSANLGVVNLYQMWVAPQFRGSGIGCALLERCIGWARSIGAAEVRLGVTLADSPAHRLYIRHGFLPVGAPEPLRDGVDLLAQNMSLCVTGNA
jgi:GNAT superfamily N-acetyltransferase